MFSKSSESFVCSGEFIFWKYILPNLLQDLFSALIKGPTRTPYEDGLFLFDIQLPNIYPAVPPLFRYLSQCSGRLNPNLYDNGKVCVSLLGTWIGKVWKQIFANDDVSGHIRTICLINLARQVFIRIQIHFKFYSCCRISCNTPVFCF